MQETVWWPWQCAVFDMQLPNRTASIGLGFNPNPAPLYLPV